MSEELSQQIQQQEEGRVKKKPSRLPHDQQCREDEWLEEVKKYDAQRQDKDFF